MMKSGVGVPIRGLVGNLFCRWICQWAFPFDTGVARIFWVEGSRWSPRRPPLWRSDESRLGEAVGRS